MPEPGPVLGVDPGEARVGLALSDPGRRVAVPLDTIPAADAVEAIAGLVAERGVTLVVVGHPLPMRGGSGDRASRAEAFAAQLAERAGVPVELQDERLSTVEADRALRATGAGGKARRAAVDRSAATIILQAWLDGAA